MTSSTPDKRAFDREHFVFRHIGPRGVGAPAPGQQNLPDGDAAVMLHQLGYASTDALMDAAVPESIRDRTRLDLPDALTETEALDELRRLAGRNQVRTSLIGQGYFGTITPPVIRRNVLESPAWYTSYTPYQAEISQGRLEALLNFQTMVEDLTGLAIANASLLDEATAVAEAVALMFRGHKTASRAARGSAGAGVVVLDDQLYPQTLAVTLGRARAAGLGVQVADLSEGLPALPDGAGPLVGIVVQQCAASGEVRDLRGVIGAAQEQGALVTVVADLLALTLLASPGELGADVAVGSAQRFGVPLFYGGPHAAFMAVRQGLERSLPGRLVGVSIDADGDPAYRLALQTREQHIRRERATSNICTAQALLAIVASMYAVYHGPRGLRAIAERVHEHAAAFADAMEQAGLTVEHATFFDTVRVAVPGRAEAVRQAALDAGINVWAPDADHVQVAFDETTTPEIVVRVADAVAAGADAPASPGWARYNGVSIRGWQGREEQVDGAAGAKGVKESDAPGAAGDSPSPAASSATQGELPTWARRTTDYLTHPVFSAHRSETSMLRYLRALSDKDLALDRTMIPLGSCTMKLNATAEMEAISWPGFADLHPFVPADQAQGYAELIATLEARLAEITGYAAVSVQPNAGSQGELAGLLAIRQYHVSRGDEARDVVLIPASAHGTNAASAALAGLRVVVVATADDGSVDLADLRAKLDQHGPQVAAIMITYPSTHGVYEEQVREVCDLVHAAGGQVYIDGANLNALVGVARPGWFGGDVSHLNLHKTFCIPHGGGGPGVGPVAVAEHLVPFLPGDALTGQGAVPVSASRYGSAGVLPISYAYIAMMGPDGLKAATEGAVLGANYVASRLEGHFPVLYTGPNGLVAHECILDLRALTAETGVTAEDVAKRLMDYGFHAPTLAFPVAGTLMVEPTESEGLDELDRFVDAMIAIRGEIDAVAAGRWAVAESPLRGAPHTAKALLVDEWTAPYSRELAAYPVAGLRAAKYWPPVRRVDGAHGDRNLVCACPPVEAFAEPAAR